MAPRHPNRDHTEDLRVIELEGLSDGEQPGVEQLGGEEPGGEEPGGEEHGGEEPGGEESAAVEM